MGKATRLMRIGRPIHPYVQLLVPEVHNYTGNGKKSAAHMKTTVMHEREREKREERERERTREATEENPLRASLNYKRRRCTNTRWHRRAPSGLIPILPTHTTTADDGSYHFGDVDRYFISRR